jgi:hypothetical protein
VPARPGVARSSSTLLKVAMTKTPDSLSPDVLRPDVLCIPLL